MRDQVKPVFILRLDTSVENSTPHSRLFPFPLLATCSLLTLDPLSCIPTEVQSEYFQTDVTNLTHMKEVLEAALEEIKQPYSRRVGRNI